YSATHLAVQIDYHPFVAQRLTRMGFQLIQDGDDEKTLIFPPDRFDEIAELVQPHVRRHLTDEQREEARKRLAAWKANAKESPEAQTGIQMPEPGSEATDLKDSA